MTKLCHQILGGCVEMTKLCHQMSGGCVEMTKLCHQMLGGCNELNNLFLFSFLAYFAEVRSKTHIWGTHRYTHHTGMCSVGHNYLCYNMKFD